MLFKENAKLYHFYKKIILFSKNSYEQMPVGRQPDISLRPRPKVWRDRCLSILGIKIKVTPAKVHFNLLYDTTLDFSCQIISLPIFLVNAFPFFKSVLEVFSLIYYVVCYRCFFAFVFSFNTTYALNQANFIFCWCN